MKSLSEQLKQILNQENSGQIISSLSSLSEKIDTQIVKLQNGLHNDFFKEIQACLCKTLYWLVYWVNCFVHFHLNYLILFLFTCLQAISCSLKTSTQKQATPSVQGPKALSATVRDKETSSFNCFRHLVELSEKFFLFCYICRLSTVVLLLWKFSFQKSLYLNASLSFWHCCIFICWQPVQ